MGRIIYVAAFLFSLTGCVSVPSHNAAQVLEVSQAQVVGCDYLGVVKGRSGWGGTMASGTGSNNAHVAAKERAAGLGGTHVVWVARGDAIQTAVAHVYRCG